MMPLALPTRPYRHRVVSTILAILALSGSPAVAEPAKLSVMSFNVENLFDIQHDPGKNDETFLPAGQKNTPAHVKKCQAIKVEKWRQECLHLDWTAERLNQKLQLIARIVLSQNEGRGADVIFLQEIENLRVLKQLTEGPLAQAGYTPVLIEGADVRGIDVAVLSKFPVVRSQLLSIPFKKIGAEKEDTRGVLSVQIKPLKGAEVSLLAVHLPAPFHPATLRKDALAYLTTLARRESQAGRTVIAAGDFNITSEEEQKEKILDPYLSEWQISHRVGCAGCSGSTYYAKDQTWSFLDQIWVYAGNSPAASKPGWKLNLPSIRVVRAIPEQVKDPGQLGTAAPEGVSDHFPVYLELTQNPGSVSK